MTILLILLGIAILICLRKKIVMCLEKCQGPWSRLLGRNRRSRSQHQIHLEENYTRVYIQPGQSVQVIQPTQYYNYNQNQQYPPTYYNYPQIYPSVQYNQGPMPMMTSQASMDDEHRAQLNRNPYESNLSQNVYSEGDTKSNNGINPYQR